MNIQIQLISNMLHKSETIQKQEPETLLL